MVNEQPGFDESDRIEAESQDSTIDLSNRPIPVGVRAIIDGRLEVACDVRYDGKDGGYRRYVVDAHTDWAKHNITELRVDEMPVDVRLIIDMHNATDAESERATANLNVIVGVSL